MKRVSSYTVTIRPFHPDDWSAVWSVIGPVFLERETFPCSPKITEEEARKYWIETPSSTLVSVDEDKSIVGTYYIMPNQPALGAHVCNCGYIVAAQSRGRGIASAMCQHSQREARAQGFRAMQYNLVVSTNEAAVHIWQKHGFRIVGTLPKAFPPWTCRSLVMYKELGSY